MMIDSSMTGESGFAQAGVQACILKSDETAQQLKAIVEMDGS